MNENTPKNSFPIDSIELSGAQSHHQCSYRLALDTALEIAQEANYPNPVNKVKAQQMIKVTRRILERMQEQTRCPNTEFTQDCPLFPQVERARNMALAIWPDHGHAADLYNIFGDVVPDKEPNASHGQGQYL